MKRAVRDALTLRAAPPRAPELSQRGDLLWIEAQYLTPDPNQPRTQFDDETLGELADSITENGLLTPLRVRPANDDDLHIITDGERRWRAGQRAGVVLYPCLVEAANQTQAFLEAYLANLHREALTAVDSAVGLQHIRETFELGGDEDVARKVNKSLGWVRQMNAVLSLDDESRQTVLDRQEPVAVAVGLRQQSPAERRQTLEAIAALPSRDRKVDFIGRVNDLRRAGQPIEEAIPAVQAALSAPDVVAPGTHESNGSARPAATPGPRIGRPKRLTLPFTWRTIGEDIGMLDVAPQALATTRLAAHRTTTSGQWVDAIVEDVTSFRDACSTSERSGEDWETLRNALLAVLTEDQNDEQAIA